MLGKGLLTPFNSKSMFYSDISMELEMDKYVRGKSMGHILSNGSTPRKAFYPTHPNYQSKIEVDCSRHLL